MISIHPRLTGVMLLAIPPIAVAAVLFGTRFGRLSKERQDLVARSTVAAEESLAGIRTVQAFGREGLERECYSRAIDAVLALSLRLAHLWGAYQALVSMLAFTAVTLVIWYGASLLLAHELTPGDLMSFADDAPGDTPPAFLPARPITSADLAALTERVRRRVIRWFRMQRLLDAAAAADMLACENSGFSVDASVRITLIDRDVPSYFGSLEHLLRYCARPPFALDRLSVTRDASGRIARIRYLLPRHKAANWVGPGRGRKSTRPGANGVVELTPFGFLDRLAGLVPPPRKHRHRYHGVFAPNHRLRSAVTSLAIGNVGKRDEAGAGGHAGNTHATGCCDTQAKPRSHDTSRIAWAKLMARVGEEFPLQCPSCGGDIRLIAFITDPGPIRKILTRLGEPLEPPTLAPARGPPADWETVCAEARKSPSQQGVSGVSVFRETASGRPGRSPRGSRVAHQPGTLAEVPLAGLSFGQSFRRRPTSCP